MFRIIKETEFKPTVVKNITETRKPLKEEKSLIEDFLNLTICITSINKELTNVATLEQDKIETIETQKQIIISAVTQIADTLGITEATIMAEKLKSNTRRKKLKEELKQAEYVEYDVIPMLRFYEIQNNLNTIINGYQEIGENITYEKTNEIATDLTRIENAMDNIGTAISNELKNNLIYKEENKYSKRS